jgi:DNA-binding CsgD family transcriptional regulator
MVQRRTSPRLVGRHGELATLTAALTASAHGTLNVVIVEGESGIGKSRLVAEALAEAGAPFRILTGQGRELERERPFGVVADALDLAVGADDPGRAAVARLLQEDPAAAPPHAEFAEVRFHVVEAILTWLARLAGERPVCLVLEDLHWADPSSLLVVDQLARRLSESPITVLATLRPSPRSATIAQLGRGLSSEDRLHLSLSPLSAGEVDELAAVLLGTPAGPGLRDLVDGAAGNPFYIVELMAALVDGGRLHGSAAGTDLDVSATSPGGLVLPTLRATILHRLEFLPARCRQILRVAAVIGSRFLVDDLSLVLDRPASDLLDILDEARRDGVLVEAGSALGFRHDLVWDALYHNLPLASREALHVQVARRLAAADRPAAQVATHFLAGAAPGDRQALAWLTRAAEEALSRAPGVAAELLRGAVELCSDDDEWLRLSVDLATALTWAGQLDEAAAVLTELANRPRGPEVDANVRLGLARVLVIQGRNNEARTQYHYLAAAELASWRRARTLTDQAVACLLGGDVSGAERAATEALELGRSAGDDPAVCGGLCASAWVANLRGRTREAVAFAERAVEVADRSSTRETRRRYPHVFLATVLVDADRIDDARRMFDTGRQIAEAFGDTWQLPIHHLGSALADFYAGAYGDAAASLVTADEVVAEVGTRTLLVWSAALAAHVAIAQDRLARARELLAAAEDHITSSGPAMGLDWLVWGQALLLEADGDVKAAADRLGAAWELAESLGIISQRRLIGPDLVRMLLAVHERTSARGIAEALTRAAGVVRVPSMRAMAERCRALVDDDPERALAAVELARGCPRRLEYARACESAGQLLAACGRTAQAGGMLRRAADRYLACGAHRDERRVDAALRSLGVVRGRRGVRSRPASGWDALTPTELSVARLAADGLTNPAIGHRLFISPRTVETHLSHVYAKLGVSSRVQLAAAAAVR